LELGPELKNLHLLVNLEVSILSSHAAVEEFIEVDKTRITFDAHSQ